MWQELHTLTFFFSVGGSVEQCSVFGPRWLGPSLRVCPQHELQAVPPPTPSCPPWAFSDSRSSKNSTPFKCSSRKRILKKFSFLSHRVCLKSAVCVYVLGRGWSSCPYHWGWKWHSCFLEQSPSISQRPATPCGWTAEVIFSRAGGSQLPSAAFFIEAWFSGSLWAVAVMPVGRKQGVKEDRGVWHLD